MKKFGISMLIIFSLIIVFILSGVVAFKLFPKDNNKETQEVNLDGIGASLFADDPYENANNSETLISNEILTIVTPALDKSKTVVRKGTSDDIIIYKKTESTIDEIDVGEVEIQSNVFLEDIPKKETQSENKKVEEKPKKEEKATESEAKEEETQVEKSEEKAEKQEEEPTEKEVEEVESPEEEEAEKQEEVKPQEPVEKAPASQSIPGSMPDVSLKEQEMPKQELDPNKQYSDTGL